MYSQACLVFSLTLLAISIWIVSSSSVDEGFYRGGGGGGHGGGGHGGHGGGGHHGGGGRGARGYGGYWGGGGYGPGGWYGYPYGYYGWDYNPIIVEQPEPQVVVINNTDAKQENDEGFW